MAFWVHVCGYLQFLIDYPLYIEYPTKGMAFHSDMVLYIPKIVV